MFHAFPGRTAICVEVGTLNTNNGCVTSAMRNRWVREAFDHVRYLKPCLFINELLAVLKIISVFNCHRLFYKENIYIIFNSVLMRNYSLESKLYQSRNKQELPSERAVPTSHADAFPSKCFNF